MTTKISKILICFLCALMVVSSVSTNAFAVSENIDLENEPALIVEFFDGEKPLSGAKFDLFMIADIDEFGNYHPKAGFEKFDITTIGKNIEKWRELALTIEGYVLGEKISPVDSAVTDENGIAFFPQNSEERFICGVYLLVGQPHTQDGFVYRAESAIVQLPMPSKEYDEWNYDVTVKPKYSFEPVGEEEEYITRKVLKIWNDKGFESKRPKEIEVYLFCDGKLFDTVKLSAENNWRYTWEKLEKDHRWNVTEKIPEGYTVKITKEGITFVIKNTAEKGTPPLPVPPQIPEKPDEPKLPQTGQLWWPVPVLFAMGTVFVALGVLCKRRDHEK
ncbi:MAG: Cna B-type domain-containing protein [Clostridia bacterium]|nr:Cna B-type domain-containing protein [Clostridia bacterium]